MDHEYVGADPNTLLRRHQKAHNWKAAVATFDQMQASGIAPSLLSCNIVISTCGKAQQLSEAHRVFNRMRWLGVQPDVFTFTSLISAHGRARRYGQANSIFEQMQAAGVTPNAVAYNAIIDACARAGKYERALDLLESMEGAGHTPNTTTFTSLMHAFAQAKRMDQAIHVLRNMLQRGVEPNLATFDGLLRACISSRQSELANDVITMMDQRGIRPRKATLSAFCTAQQALGFAARAEVVGGNPADPCAYAQQPHPAEYEVAPQGAGEQRAYAGEVHAHGANPVALGKALFESKAQQRDMPTDAVTFSVLINEAARDGNVDSASALFAYMLALQVTPPSALYDCLLELCQANLSKIHDHMNEMVA
jgi:pentatricopeptide repeat protein